MRPLGSGLAFLAIVAAMPAQAAPRAVLSMMTHRPEHVGQCFSTQVRQVTFRLFDEAVRRPVLGSGSKILFADGHENVAYDQIPAIRRGSAFAVCLPDVRPATAVASSTP